MRVETEREEDGRWIAEVIELPGVMVYGRTRKVATPCRRCLATNGNHRRCLHPRIYCLYSGPLR